MSLCTPRLRQAPELCTLGPPALHRHRHTHKNKINEVHANDVTPYLPHTTVPGPQELEPRCKGNGRMTPEPAIQQQESEMTLKPAPGRMAGGASPDAGRPEVGAEAAGAA